VNGTACGRRVVKLYGSGRWFLCRHCYRLGHASQSESELQRRIRHVSKVMQRLGGDPGLLALCPSKPKGMWRRTYARLLEQLLLAQVRADEARAHALARLLARIERWQRTEDTDDERAPAGRQSATKPPSQERADQM
jgi:hypothetical protein